MPDFIYDKMIYYTPVEFAMDRIGGTWKMPILWSLRNKTLRYSNLKKELPQITHKNAVRRVAQTGEATDLSHAKSSPSYRQGGVHNYKTGPYGNFCDRSDTEVRGNVDEGIWREGERNVNQQITCCPHLWILSGTISRLRNPRRSQT